MNSSISYEVISKLFVVNNGVENEISDTYNFQVLYDRLQKYNDNIKHLISIENPSKIKVFRFRER